VDRIRALIKSATSPKHNYRPHQPDASSLYQSAFKECWICAQIFEDVCKRFMEEDRFPQNSTPAEIVNLILEAATQKEKTDYFSGNFTIYELRDSNGVDGGDMTLCIYVEDLHSPQLGYEYNLVDQSGMLIHAA
jgi:hypothetical protein